MRNLLISMLLLLAGCGFQKVLGGDREPPRVVSIEPADGILREAVPIVVHFSEAVVLEEEPFSYVLLKPKSEEVQRSKRILCDVVLSEDGMMMTISPKWQNHDTQYVLTLLHAIRDKKGNPLADASGLKSDYTVTFRTLPQAPIVLSHDVPLGDVLVQPFSNRFAFRFSQEVKEFDTAAFRLEGDGAFVTSLRYYPQEKIVLLETSPLLPESSYALVWGEGLENLSGVAIKTHRAEFHTGDRRMVFSSPMMQVEAIAYERHAEITVEGHSNFDVWLWYGEEGGELDCLEQKPCPLRRLPLEEGVLRVDNLQLARSYRYRMLAEDNVGRRLEKEAVLHTSAVGKLEIKRILANPDVMPESKGEYIEIVNSGENSVDLSQIRLEISKEKTTKSCVLSEQTLLLAPAQDRWLVGKAFDLSLYKDMREHQLLRLPQNALCGGLANGKKQKFVLKDAFGRVLFSQMGV